MLMSNRPLGQAVVESMADTLEVIESKLTAGGRYSKAQRLVDSMSIEDVIGMLSEEGTGVLCRALEVECAATRKVVQLHAGIIANLHEMAC